MPGGAPSSEFMGDEMLLMRGRLAGGAPSL
jgi:hypothetical protein